MRTVAIALLAGAGALSVGSAARASDFYTTSEYSNPELVQKFAWSATTAANAIAPAAASA